MSFFTNPPSNAIPISEHILALMLARARDISFSLRQQIKRQWIRRGRVCELEGSIARGSIVQEKALIRALQEGWIAGAGLDVFETEPLPEDSPLWEMENVTITGHYAGATPFYFDRVMEIFLENLRRYQRGEPLINQVDKQRGY